MSLHGILDARRRTFSKSRRHAVWLPSFLERFDPDTLRYYLSINMPENHDTDFNWPDFVEKSILN